MSNKLRILFYGTHLKHYYLAKWLRQKGYECTLLLTDYKEKNRPEAAEPILLDNYPSWIVDLKSKPNSVYRRIMRWFCRSEWMPFALQKILLHGELNPSKRAYALVEKHDLVFTSGAESLMHCFRFGKPVVFRALGSDLCKSPFKAEPFSYEFLSYQLRLNIKKVKKILLYQVDTVWAARFLGVSDKVAYYSVPTDIQLMASNIDQSFYCKVKEKYKQHKTVFYMPSRKNMDPASTDYKGCEKALEAFRCLKEEGFKFRVVASARGVNAALFKDMIHKFGLDEIVDLVEEEPLYRLAAYLTQPNFIVVNDLGFEKEHLTGIAREAISLGAILVDSVDMTTDMFTSIYGPAEDLGVYKAVEATRLCCVLRDTLRMDIKTLQNLKEANSSWALKYLDKNSTLKGLEVLLNESAC